MKFKVIEHDPEYDQSRIAIRVYIRSTDTGGIVCYNTWCLLQDGEEVPSLFIWHTGNFSCDCNRELFYKEVRDGTRPGDAVCGEDRYQVHIINPVDQETLYEEFPRELITDLSEHPCTWCTHMRPCAIDGFRCAGDCDSNEAALAGNCEGKET